MAEMLEVIPPAPDESTQFYWDGVKEHQLIFLRCRNCSHFIHPPRPICRHCLSRDLVPERVSGRATLYTWTVNNWPSPRIVISAELAEDPTVKVISNLIDCPEEEMRIGMALEVSFQDVSPEVTLPMFRRAE